MVPTNDNGSPVYLAGLAEMFKIGIGPSSSHTVGPMKAAHLFLQRNMGSAPKIHRLKAILYGSLASTGRGHATDKAIILGLSGETPDDIDPDYAEKLYRSILNERKIALPDGRKIDFDPGADVVFDTSDIALQHPNTMRFEAFDKANGSLYTELWFSIGGGFVHRDGEKIDANITRELPYPFRNGAELLKNGKRRWQTIAEMALVNEDSRRPRKETIALIEKFKETMLACICRGLKQEGELPGGLNLQRQAKKYFDKLTLQTEQMRSPFWAMECVSAFAIGVNEENAAGGRIVTAPTNGAAGVVPAVLRYYLDFCPNAHEAGVQSYFLAASMIGSLIKLNASISGAEVGCQGEVGAASSMAAAGLAAALGATNEQTLNAAALAMEHHLGLTCDPVGGLVQIPCIERNAFGAVKAITATSLAMLGDGMNRISFDQVIETMRQTGLDMHTKYKETSQGGLAICSNVCFPARIHDNPRRNKGRANKSVGSNVQQAIFD